MENYLSLLFGGHVCGAVGSRGRLASGNLGVRIPAATDLSRKTGSVSPTAKHSGICVSVTGTQR